MIRDALSRLDAWLLRGADDAASVRRAHEHVLGSRAVRFVPAAISGLVSVIWLGWPVALVWIAAVIGLQEFVLQPLFRVLAKPCLDSHPKRAAWIMAGLISIGSIAYCSGWTLSWLVGDELAVFRAALWFAATLVHALVYFGTSRLFFLATAWPALACVLATPLIRPGPDYAPAVIAALAVHLFLVVITARRDKETLTASLAQSKAERAAAMQASAAKSQFLAGMSHELRTPLNAIIGYSEMLKEDAEDAGREEDAADLERIRVAGAHLLDLINEVLDLSKVEAGRMEARTETVDPAQMLHETVDNVRRIAVENGTAIDLVLDPNLRPFETDPVKLRQCVLNLASNACKFTENGRVIIAARFEGEGRARMLRVSVADTGIGIAAADAERLFEPFTQVHDPAKTRHAGTGLGLALTRRLAQFLDGDVAVESVLGEGSTFTLRIGAPDGAVEEAETGEGPLVLVVDDVRVARESARRALDGLPVRVQTVSSAAAAIEAFHARRPRLVVLDINLSDGSGWRVLEEIRAHPKGKHVQAIVVSVEADHALGRSLGVHTQLSKPFARAQLSEAVADALGLSGAPAAQVA